MALIKPHLIASRRWLLRAAVSRARICASPTRGASRQPLRCASSSAAQPDAVLAAGDELQLTCTGVSSSGEGVCRTPSGMVVFVERALPGEVCEARVVQSKKSYAKAVKLRSLSPHTDAAEPPCRHFGPCGGCSLQSLQYAVQLWHKQAHVTEQLAKIGKVEGAAALVRPILPCLETTEHRNKMEFSFSMQSWQPQPAGSSNGADCGGSVQRGFALGLFRPGSNRVVLPVSECRLQPGLANKVLALVGGLCREAGLQPYDPTTRRGLLQALVIRTAAGTGAAPLAEQQQQLQQLGAQQRAEQGQQGLAGGREVLLNFVTARDGRRELAPLVPAILQQFPGVVGVVNTTFDPRRPPGERAIAAEHVLAGRPFLVEPMCGLEFEISANSFFQTNTRQAERLYGVVAQAAELRPTDMVLDLYCGTGTIGLVLARSCREVHGVELAPPAVRDARRNAARNAIPNAHFWLADLSRASWSSGSSGGGGAGGELVLPATGAAGKGAGAAERAEGRAAARAAEGPAEGGVGARLPAPDVVVVDPARPGLSPGVVAFLRRSGARRVVYVSCNPATQARDIALLSAPAPAAAAGGGSRGGEGAAGGAESAYRLAWVQPVDLFPHTMHVESVAVLDRVVVG